MFSVPLPKQGGVTIVLSKLTPELGHLSRQLRAGQPI